MSENQWQIPPAGGHMDAADGIYFQNMTALEVEARLKENDLLIIPVGSAESHGPHACYGEDTFLVTRMAEEALLDYMVRLHDDIMERFPPGVLPDASLVTQRFTQEEVDEFLTGPLKNGKHLYTIAWPPI